MPNRQPLTDLKWILRILAIGFPLLFSACRPSDGSATSDVVATAKSLAEAELQRHVAAPPIKFELEQTRDSSFVQFRGYAEYDDQIWDIIVTPSDDRRKCVVTQRIPDSYTQGEKCLNNEDYTTAISLLGDAIQQNKGFLKEAYFSRARAYFRLKKYDEAISDVTEAMRRGLDTADAYDLRGVAHYNKGELDHYKLAVLDFTNVIRLAPSARAYFLRGASYNHGGGDAEKAIADLTVVIEMEPDNAEAYHERFLAKRSRTSLLQGLFGKEDYSEDFKKAQELGYKD